MMDRNKLLLAATALMLCTSLLVGCVQYPTEQSNVVDLRPQISFRFDPIDADRLNDARVIVDGLDAGRIADFADGKGALRVLPGSHQIRVVSDGRIILDERTYLADGVNRPINIK